MMGWLDRWRHAFFLNPVYLYVFKKIIIIIFLINIFFIILKFFNILVLKITFFKYYFNIFLNKKYLKNNCNYVIGFSGRLWDFIYAMKTMIQMKNIIFYASYKHSPAKKALNYRLLLKSQVRLSNSNFDEFFNLVRRPRPPKKKISGVKTGPKMEKRAMKVDDSARSSLLGSSDDDRSPPSGNRWETRLASHF